MGRTQGSPPVLLGNLPRTISQGHTVTAGAGARPRAPPPPPLRPRRPSAAAHQGLCLYCNWRNAVKPVGLSGRATAVIREALNRRQSWGGLSGNESLSAEPQHALPALLPRPPPGDTPPVQGLQAAARPQDGSGDDTAQHCHLAGGRQALSPVSPATQPHPAPEHMAVHSRSSGHTPSFPPLTGHGLPGKGGNAGEKTAEKRGERDGSGEGRGQEELAPVGARAGLGSGGSDTARPGWARSQVLQPWDLSSPPSHAAASLPGR